MTTNTDPVRALADELQQAAAGEDIPSAAAAYADCAGRLRTLAKSLASAPPSAPVGVEAAAHVAMLRSLRMMYAEGAMEADDHPGTIAALDAAISALAQQPAAPSGAVNVVGMPEFDGLLGHIYEYGTAAEGVIERANAFARAVLARYAPQQPAIPEGMLLVVRSDLEAVLSQHIPHAIYSVRNLHDRLATQQQGGRDHG